MTVSTFLWLAWLPLAVQGEYLHAQKDTTIRVVLGIPSGVCMLAKSLDAARQ
jgi:hypothetical protein